jgi:hypothetical protein
MGLLCGRALQLARVSLCKTQNAKRCFAKRTEKAADLMPKAAESRCPFFAIGGEATQEGK